MTDTPVMKGLIESGFIGFEKKPGPKRQVSPAELEALRAFAAAHGRHWKHKLASTYWYNARIWRATPDDNGTHGTALHGLRNDLGNAWLAGFRFPK
jgi:hypothetical protein